MNVRVDLSPRLCPMPQEAWKQQQLARYWNRQALEAEAAAKKALPPKARTQVVFFRWR